MSNALRYTRLHLVTDRTLCKDVPLEKAVAQAVEGGVDAVHLREKDLSSAELYDLAVKLKRVTAEKAMLFVNDRIDIALAISADGVHLPANSLPMYVAKKLGDDRLLIGKSVHSVEEAVHAQEEEADYIILGTIYETESHPGHQAAGPELVKAVREKVSIPIYAIGGITVRNARYVMAAGADGVVVIRAILAAEDRKRAARELKQSLSGGIDLINRDVRAI